MTDPFLAHIKRSKVTLIEYSGSHSTELWLEALIRPPRVLKKGLPGSTNDWQWGGDMLITTMPDANTYLADKLTDKGHRIDTLGRKLMSIDGRQLHIFDANDPYRTDQLCGISINNLYVLLGDSIIRDEKGEYFHSLIPALVMGEGNEVKPIHYKRRF